MSEAEDMMQQAYTSVPEWGWTLLVSVHRTGAFDEVPRAEGAFRLFWLVEGSAELEINGNTLNATGPCLLCLGSRDRLVGRGAAEVRAVVFHPGALNDAFLSGDVYNLEAFQGTTKSDQYYLHPFLRSPDAPVSVVSLPLGAVDRIQLLFDRMEGEITDRTDGFWPCRTRSLLLEVLILARQGLAPVTEPGLVDRVLVHLHTHYADSFTLPHLAARFATNRTTLAARFKEQTGHSVGDYVRGLRVRVAELILRDTTLPVQEVMERVGFVDPSQFGRLFRRATGLSPSAYRQQHNWMLRSAS